MAETQQWVGAVGTAGLEAGGTWETQYGVLLALATALKQQSASKDLAQLPGKVASMLVRMGGFPSQPPMEGKAVSTSMWRYICALMSVKYDLRHPEDVEAAYGIICGGGAPATTADWEFVRSELKKQGQGKPPPGAAQPPQQVVVMPGAVPDMERGGGGGGAQMAPRVGAAAALSHEMQVLHAAFESIDADSSGAITFDEFISAMASWQTRRPEGHVFTEPELYQIFHMVIHHFKCKMQHF